MTEEHLKNQIVELIKALKPEIRERAAFVFGGYKGEASDRFVLADTAFMTVPPVITFYLKAIEEMGTTENILEQIISHEIIHTFSKNELEAYSKQNFMDFFDETKP